MSAGDYQFSDGQNTRAGLKFAVARKLFRYFRHKDAAMTCDGKKVLFRVEKTK